MKRDLVDIDREFGKLVRILIRRLMAKNYHPKVYQKIRHPREQAILWRKGRSTVDINNQIKQLKQLDAPYLAGLLKDVGPQYGPRVTGALPGESWHQWGEAVDIYFKDPDGTPIWELAYPGYKYMATIAKELGLTSGYDWLIRDGGHIQKQRASVRKYFSWKEINDIMLERFGEDEND